MPGDNGGHDNENSIRKMHGETAPARECGCHCGHATRRGGHRGVGHVDGVTTSAAPAGDLSTFETMRRNVINPRPYDELSRKV